MVVTETAGSSTANEGGQTAGTGAESTIPYARFREVNEEKKAAREEAETLRKQLSELSKTQAPQVPQQANGKFKANYANIDEFYGDIVKTATNDPAFLDALLNGLFEKNGDKFDDVLFQSLTRKNQKITQESEQITQKMVEENDQKLDKIESDFGEDTEGFQGFKDWVEELVVDKDPKEVPPWARDLDSLYDVYKRYNSQKQVVPQQNAARKISRAKVGGKVAPQLDMSGDIRDVLRRAAEKGTLTK